MVKLVKHFLKRNNFVQFDKLKIQLYNLPSNSPVSTLLIPRKIHNNVKFSFSKLPPLRSQSSKKFTIKKISHALLQFHDDATRTTTTTAGIRRSPINVTLQNAASWRSSGESQCAQHGTTPPAGRPSVRPSFVAPEQVEDTIYWIRDGPGLRIQMGHYKS